MRLTGKNAVALWIDSNGTVNLSPNMRNFSFGHEQEMADVTAGADDYRAYSKTVKSITPTCDILVEDLATGSAVLKATSAGNVGTLLWGNEGTAAGKPKWGIAATVTKADEDIPYDDAIIRSMEWANASGALLFDGNLAVW